MGFLTESRARTATKKPLPVSATSHRVLGFPAWENMCGFLHRVWDLTWVLMLVLRLSKCSYLPSLLSFIFRMTVHGRGSLFFFLVEMSHSETHQASAQFQKRTVNRSHPQPKIAPLHGEGQYLESFCSVDRSERPQDPQNPQNLHNRDGAGSKEGQSKKASSVCYGWIGARRAVA